MSVTLERLRVEFQDATIGTLLFSEIERAMRTAVKGRNPAIYGGGAGSWDDALDDAVQGLVVDRLIADGQLAYVMREAGSLQEFRKLMVGQARRHLSKVRVRSVVDQLLLRSRKIVDGAPETFEVCDRKRSVMRRFALAPLSVEVRDATDHERASAVRAAGLFPVTFGTGGEKRAPSVYNTPVLKSLLVKVCEVLPCSVHLSDLDHIFSWTLTDWVVGDLKYIEAAMSLEAKEPDPAVVTRATQMSTEFIDGRAEDDLHLLALALSGAKGGEIATALGVSRQTVIARRQKIVAALEDVVSDESDEFVRCFFDSVNLEFAMRSF